jgi:hypothetical protein
VLEQLFAGETVAPEIVAHAERCPDCSAQLSALRAETDAFVRARPPERFVKQLDRRAQSAAARSPWRRFLPALAFAVPVALAVLIVPRVIDSGDEVRLKGDGFRVAVARSGAAGSPELLENDAPVSAGDALRFSYEASENGHLLVLDVDGRGDVSVLYPYGASRSAPISAGDTTFLPGSVVLDDAPGPELLVAVFSPKPLDAAPLVESLKAQAGRPSPKVACDACKITSLRLQKRP